jgi:hypothetical protein
VSETRQNGGLESNAESYRWLNPVFLGDDLYAGYPTCRAILENKDAFSVYLQACQPPMAV